MVTRIKVECRACHKVFALRIQRSGGRQPFVLACPYCSTQIRAVLADRPDGTGSIETEDFDELPRDAQADVAVAVSTEVPIHKTAIGEPLERAMLTPFIRLISAIGNSAAYPITQRVDFGREMREHCFPHIRRALAFLVRNDLEGVGGAIAELRTLIRRLPSDALHALGVCLSLTYQPYDDRLQFRSARQELLRTLANAHSRDRAVYNSLLAAFDAGPLPRHAGRVFDTTAAVLDDTAALIPAVWARAIVENGLPIEDYRVMRDDFDSIKVRYQDIFELASRSLVFATMLRNIAVRGDAVIFVDGVRRTLDRALNNTPAAIREGWLVEFPAAKALYDSMQRHMRNHIGHRLVRYDFVSGNVIDDDGAATNYLLFLMDYLDAIRVSHLLAETALLLRPECRPH